MNEKSVWFSIFFDTSNDLAVQNHLCNWSFYMHNWVIGDEEKRVCDSKTMKKSENKGQNLKNVQF